MILSYYDMPRNPTDADYQELLEIRTSLRRFLLWSQERAAEVGLAPGQYQLLLAVRGHPGGGPPTVREIAWHLLLRHHSAVQLIDRAERVGLVRRRRDDGDRRVVRVELTPAGEAKLRQLAPAHLDELTRLAPRFRRLLSRGAQSVGPTDRAKKPVLA
jgi:DNA-binding MarR family transcriptional regulator